MQQEIFADLGVNDLLKVEAFSSINKTLCLFKLTKKNLILIKKNLFLDIFIASIRCSSLIEFCISKKVIEK